MIYPLENLTLNPINIGYNGSKMLPQQYVEDVTMCSGIVNGRQGIIVTVVISRPLFSSILTVFMPTSIMFLLSHIVHIFHRDYLDMVIQVNLTLILVLATL